MALRISISVPGLANMRKKLGDESWYAKPWADGLDQLGRLGRDTAKRAASGFSRTGRNVEKITYAVQRKPLPVWVAIRATASTKAPSRRARRAAGRTKYPFAYPKLLNYSPKHGHKGWFTDAINATKGQIDRIFTQIGERIGQAWGS